MGCVHGGVSQKRRGKNRAKLTQVTANSFLSTAQRFFAMTYKTGQGLLGLVSQHSDRCILGKMLGRDESHKQTGKRTQAWKGVCAHTFTCTHTQASCCDTPTFLTAVQLQGKKSVSTRVNQRRAHNTPLASSAAPELLSSTQKQTLHF